LPNVEKQSTKKLFAECQKKTLSKEACLPIAKKNLANNFFAECFLTLGKEASLSSVFLTLSKELL
jgi:hypothetical protein